MFSLTNKYALVTGASRGLGQAIAIALAQAGAIVICTASKINGCAETCSIIKENGGSAFELAADLSDTEAVKQLIHSYKEEFKRIDILVNNAGMIYREPAEKHSLQEWQSVLQVNLTSCFQLCQAFGSMMMEQKSGKIINIASLLSFQGGITVPSYAASKHAVAGLTKALANEWAIHNIQVNAIAPGYFKTDNTLALQNNEVRNRQILERIPAGKWGEASDLNGAAVFLASDASNYVNGHVLVVDGGWMAR